MDQWYAMLSWFIAGKITELKSRLKKKKNYIDPNQNPFKYIYTYTYDAYMYIYVWDKDIFCITMGSVHMFNTNGI